MDDLDLIKWVIMGGLGVVMWFLRTTLEDTRARIKKLEDDQQIIQRDYLHKKDFSDFKIELYGLLKEIRDDVRGLRNHEKG